MVLTGANAILVWRDDANTKLRPVGVGVKISTFESDYQMEKIWGIGDRTYDLLYSKGFSGSLSFDIILGDADNEFLDVLLTAGKIGSIPDVYIFTTDNATPITGTNNGFSDPTQVKIYKIAGWKADSMKITMRSGEYIGVSFDGKFSRLEDSDITIDTTNNAYSYNSTDYAFDISDLLVEPLTFARASLTTATDTSGTAWNAVDVDLVKDFEIDVKHNLEAIYSLNSMFPRKFVEQKFDLDISMTAYFNDYTQYENLLSSLRVSASDSVNTKFVGAYTYPNTAQGVATLKIEALGESGKKHTFTIYDAGLTSFSNVFEEANVVEGSFKFMGRYLTYSYA